MAQLTPYLTYGGNCREAFEYYREHIGATELMIRPFRGSPAEADVPEDWKDKTLHASLMVGGNMLLASDCPPHVPYHGMQGVSIMLSTPTDAETQRIFDALARGGRIIMPLGQTFWASSFGMVTDQFGAPWMVMTDSTLKQ